MEELNLTTRKRHEVIAFVAGGAALYKGANQRNTVGEENARVLLQELRRHGIQVGGRDIGGEASRQLVVDGASGRVFTLLLEGDGHGTAWSSPAGLLRRPAPSR